MDKIIKQRVSQSKKNLEQILIQKVGLRPGELIIEEWDFDIHKDEVREYNIFVTYKVYSDSVLEDIYYNAKRVFDKIEETVNIFTISADGKLLSLDNNPHKKGFFVGGMINQLNYSINEETVTVNTNFYCSYDF
jgi:FlaA1/EpsC-like NDP-sugar epimerase